MCSTPVMARLPTQPKSNPTQTQPKPKTELKRNEAYATELTITPTVETNEVLYCTHNRSNCFPMQLATIGSKTKVLAL